jgi:hypothetical protein
MNYHLTNKAFKRNPFNDLGWVLAGVIFSIVYLLVRVIQTFP